MRTFCERFLGWRRDAGLDNTIADRLPMYSARLDSPIFGLHLPVPSQSTGRGLRT